MKRLGAALAVVCLLGVALAFSEPGKPVSEKPAGELAVQVEGRNPWTHTSLNNAADEFQFAIVSDRTGGHRANVFSRAVEKLNLLQPEFVLSVGDLIEGGNKDADKLTAEWRELDGYVQRLRMPFFYVPGNHDYGNAKTAQFWKEKFGRSYYHFVYKGVLFLCLNTEDPPGSGKGHLGKEQVVYAQRVLADNRGVRWTIVSMHKPVWTAAKLPETGWLDIEKVLDDRPYTVFVGHVHQYQKFVRNGRNYYQLATTGGGSKMRGLSYGEFDHIVWVTMKKDGPVLANVLLDAVLPEDLSTPATNEPGVSTAKQKPTFPLRGQIFFEGAPAPGAYVVFQQIGGKDRRTVRADGMAEADSSFTLSTYQANDGVPEGDYAVTVVWRKPFVDAAGKPGPNVLPQRYAKAETSGLKATIKPGRNDVVLELHK
jgi:serine/threonine-protein phosphatase CPPED1